MSRLLDVAASITRAPLDPATVVAGGPQTGSRALSVVGGLEVGVWEMTPGTCTDVEVDEVFVVLEGSGSVRFADGEELTLVPGTVVRLHAGDETTWTVHTTIRKLYLA